MELKPFNIGPIEVRFPVVLAALAGYSDLPYRRLCRELGAGYCATEMVLDRSLLISGKLQRRLLVLTDDDHPIAGQLIGHEPEDMARAAALVCDRGFDVVDLNFACPMRKAVARGRGGALMARPALAIEIVRAVVQASSCPVTLKLRSGYDASDVNHECFWRIAEESFDAGVAGICVHARTVGQRYVGLADWSFLAEVKRRFPDRTIIGSGDARTPAQALALLAETKVDAVAAARGALGNPWFFRQAMDVASGREPYRPSLAEQRDLMLRHFLMACELYGPTRGPRIMRKHGIKYAHMHPTSKKVRMAFAEVRNPDEWRQVLDEFYSDSA
jgi:tRNA-dihydrouridine synthase B